MSSFLKNLQTFLTNSLKYNVLGRNFRSSFKAKRYFYDHKVCGEVEAALHTESSDTKIDKEWVSEIYQKERQVG